MKTKAEKTKVPLTKRPIFWEIVRFVIVGGIATIADFAVSSLFLYVIYTSNETVQILWMTFTKKVILSTIMGFIVGVIVNYILSIVVVFKNVANKKRSQSVGGFIVFVLLGFLGMIINLLLKEAGNAIIPYEGNVWWFIIVFAIATLIVLVYNYLTRKFILFRAPKNNEENGKINKQNVIEGEYIEIEKDDKNDEK
ncbi:MAG: GtrA family protein [Bacilli bacterium]|jgi:putative flippase GtrA